MAYAIPNEERAGQVPVVCPASPDWSLVRGVVAGLVLVAPFWIVLALALLIQFH